MKNRPMRKGANRSRFSATQSRSGNASIVTSGGGTPAAAAASASATSSALRSGSRIESPSTRQVCFPPGKTDTVWYHSRQYRVRRRGHFGRDHERYAPHGSAMSRIGCAAPIHECAYTAQGLATHCYLLPTPHPLAFARLPLPAGEGRGEEGASSPVHAACTKLWITVFAPAFSKSISRRSPSTARTAP